MLVRQRLLDAPGLRAHAVRCPGGVAWSAEEEVTGTSVVLVRRGVFRRRVRGVSRLVDPLFGYVQRAGECQQMAHPAGGDVCTSLTVPDELGERLAAAGPLVVSPAADLAHRRLLAASAAVDGLEVEAERAHRRPLAGSVRFDALAAGAEAHRRPLAGSVRVDALEVEAERAHRRPLAGSAQVDALDAAGQLLALLLPPLSATPRADRRVDEVRAELHAAPGRPLDELAASVGWSPWYLSRVFHRVTGLTLGAYRRRVRVRAALDALATGDDSLAEIAACSGFADQAHLTRALRREIDLPPAAARRLLRPGELSGQSASAGSPSMLRPLRVRQ